MPTHVPIVSRGHASFLNESSAAVYAVGRGREGTNLLINDGSGSNPQVPHLHLHLISRQSGNLPRLFWRPLVRMGHKRLQRRQQIEAEQRRRILGEEN